MFSYFECSAWKVGEIGKNNGQISFIKLLGVYEKFILFFHGTATEKLQLSPKISVEMEQSVNRSIEKRLPCKVTNMSQAVSETELSYV